MGYPEIALTGARCIGLDRCGWCLDICPIAAGAAFRLEGGKVCGIDRQACTRCLECAPVCPANAIRVFGRKMNVAEVLREILSDREFYTRSGGGVTISGGEPLVQWQFALELLQACKRESVHTCLESVLYCREEILADIAPFVDIVYTDVKHMDPARHAELTGVDNQVILSNIRMMARMGKPLVIRIPVVPGYNDGEDNLRATAEFIRNDLDNRVLQVQLLPYRPLGREKYKALGMEDPMDQVTPWERSEYEKEIHRLADILKSCGIPATAGAAHSLPAGVRLGSGGDTKRPAT